MGFVAAIVAGDRDVDRSNPLVSAKTTVRREEPPCPECGKKLRRDSFGRKRYSAVSWCLLAGAIPAALAVAVVLASIDDDPEAAALYAAVGFGVVLFPLVAAGFVLPRVRVIRCRSCDWKEVVKLRSRMTVGEVFTALREGVEDLD